MINLDELKEQLVNKRFDDEKHHPQWLEGRLAGIVEAIDAIVEEVGKDAREPNIDNKPDV